jgi:hypothetical protein
MKLTGRICCLILAFYFAGCATATTVAPTDSSTAKYNDLVGTWVRNGIYELTVERINPLEVKYYNVYLRRWVTVQEATLRLLNDGTPSITVTFNDNDYRGSRYDLSLVYGRLVGSYSTESRITYRVSFQRKIKD